MSWNLERGSTQQVVTGKSEGCVRDTAAGVERKETEVPVFGGQVQRYGAQSLRAGAPDSISNPNWSPAPLEEVL